MSFWLSKSFALALLLLASRADAAPTYDVRAAVDASGEHVVLSEDVADPPVDRSGALLLWLYADRARDRPPSLDDLSAERLFPGGLSTGGVDRLTVTIEGCDPIEIGAASAAERDPVRGRTVSIAICAKAAAPLRAHLAVAMTLPRRFGTLGRTGEETCLGDPWYPLFLTPGQPAASAPPLAAHVVTIASAVDRVLVGPSVVTRGRTFSVHDAASTHVPIFLLDQATITTEVTRGVDVTYVTRRPVVPRGTSREDPLRDGDPFDPDSTRRIQATVQQGVSFLRQLGFSATTAATPRGMRSHLIVVEIAERQRLGVALGGVIAVSDRAFRLLPIDRVERFHRDALLRHVFASLVDPHVTSAESERDVPWVEDLDGSLLTDLLLASEQVQRDSPKDLVGFAGFHPAVDQLLYAPQVAFRSAYFHEVDEPDPDRDGANRALNDGPFGHLILEKLRDHLGTKPFGDAARAHLFDGSSWRRMAERVSGEPQQWFFDQWLRRRRKIAYRLAGHTSLRTTSGYEHHVRVERLGEIEVREPVVVEVIDDDGHHARGQWDAAGAFGVVTLTTPGPLRDAQVDPEGRLTQDPSLSRGHPRFDDELRHTWRPPVFNNFAFGASVLEAKPEVEVDFSLKRRYDVRNTISFRALESYRGTSGSIRYTRGIGDLRDLNNVDRSITVSLGGLYSTTGFGGVAEDVTSGTLGVTLSQDSRKIGYAPSIGRSITINASVGMAHSKSNPALLTTTLGIRAQQLFWPHLDHTLALTAGAAVVRCPALPQSLTSLSGRQIFRGYEVDELLGCSSTYLMLEERWAVVRGLYVNAGDLAWGRRLDLVPFVGAGFLSSRRTALDLFARPIFDAGVGLRALYDYFGVQPGVLAVDVGVPLSRTSTCASHNTENRCTRLRQPLGLYLSFEQTL